MFNIGAIGCHQPWLVIGNPFIITIEGEWLDPESDRPILRERWPVGDFTQNLCVFGTFQHAKTSGYPVVWKLEGLVRPFSPDNCSRFTYIITYLTWMVILEVNTGKYTRQLHPNTAKHVSRQCVHFKVLPTWEVLAFAGPVICACVSLCQLCCQNISPQGVIMLHDIYPPVN